MISVVWLCELIVDAVLIVMIVPDRFVCAFFRRSQSFVVERELPPLHTVGAEEREIPG